jgi:hypothetical protein
MYCADDLLKKLSEIETLIRERINPDGSLDFDPEKAMVSLELARRMIVQENSD